MQTIVRIAAKGFGIALMLCAALTKIVDATIPHDNAFRIAVTPIPEVPLFAKPEILFLVGIVFTAVGYLLKRDRDSIDERITTNHEDVVKWLGKIDTKVHSTSEKLCALSAACEERRRVGGCQAPDSGGK